MRRIKRMSYSFTIILTYDTMTFWQLERDMSVRQDSWILKRLRGSPTSSSESGSLNFLK